MPSMVIAAAISLIAAAAALEVQRDRLGWSH
jgi:hypothetical protein